jgi:hypothetical protein
MRTTLTLDDDVAARLKAEARRTGMPFKTVVNEYLRAALARRRELKALPPFLLSPQDLGGPLPGRSYDDIGGLLDEIEGTRKR